MPLRQIRKHKNSKSKSNSHSRSRKTNSKYQRGGDPGRVALPMAYFSKNNTAGYYADGSSALNSCGKQHAVSQGVISANGKLAGPNLYPMMGGSSCNKKEFKPKTMKGGSSCNKKEFKPKTMKGGSCNKKTKSHKSKSRKH